MTISDVMTDLSGVARRNDLSSNEASLNKRLQGDNLTGNKEDGSRTEFQLITTRQQETMVTAMEQAAKERQKQDEQLQRSSMGL